LFGVPRLERKKGFFDTDRKKLQLDKAVDGVSPKICSNLTGHGKKRG
jgi:hypothetical protein